MTANTPLDNLRPGEDPGSAYPGDSRHWVGIYSELLRLLDEAILELDSNRQLSRTELDDYRLVFQERRSFWEGRLCEQEEPSLRRRAQDRSMAPPPSSPQQGSSGVSAS